MHGVKPGPKPYLNKAEGSKLEDFFEVTSTVGKTWKQVMDIVESTAQYWEKQKLVNGGLIA